ncbi:MAG TPA: GNAT family N-acetyltransferase [Pseudonocardiaceae bacterium]|jgi:ribosomal protein S18 acetylase RimI-like enzyme
MPTALPGQDALLASWRALALTSPGARLEQTDSAVGAVFPAWAPLNNVIVLGEPGTAAVVAAKWRRRYADAGVTTWALWVPGLATTFDASDVVSAIPGMRRDETTLVMTAPIPAGLPSDHGVVSTSLDSALRAGDEPVPRAELGAPGTTEGLATWALVRDGLAVASGWTYRHGTESGIYAVGTVPAWRRQGLGGALMRHLLADGAADGARTATLQSTPMGQHLYESLGFVAVGRYEEWVPE